MNETRVEKQVEFDMMGRTGRTREVRFEKGKPPVILDHVRPSTQPPPNPNFPAARERRRRQIARGMLRVSEVKRG